MTPVSPQPSHPSPTAARPPVPAAPPPPSPPPSPSMGGASAPGKRRSASVARPDPDPHHHPPKLPPFPAHPADAALCAALPCDLRANRRKRFLAYTLAFATMLALSSILDIRRAAFKNRRSKVQLVLPSGSSLSSISDDKPVDAAATAAAAAAAAPDPAHPNPAVSLRPVGAPPPLPVNSHPDPASHHPPADDPMPPDDLYPKPADVNLSEQELKDDVDQFIAHVDQETTVDATAASANATLNPALSNATLATPSTDHSSSTAHHSTEHSTHHTSLMPSSTTTSAVVSTAPATSKDAAAPPSNSTIPASESEVRLNSEEHFNSAQKRLDQLLHDDSLKKLVDENDLRTLQALELQATRGDCEMKSASEGGSLFKTDAEAASNVDIERTDALWGAWCLFMGSYKTDAMRDFVTKQRVVEDKVLTAQARGEPASNATTVAFDPNAASLDDFMTPEEQSSLRIHTDTIMAHLQPYDIRYLAALSLQATYGDCGPYGKEAQLLGRDGEDDAGLRKLVEPLLGQTVQRRKGAQWGAWCVMQGKKRASAASELSQRVSFLVDQLSKSQATVDHTTSGTSLPQTTSREISLGHTGEFTTSESRLLP